MTGPRYPSLYQVNTRVWLTELSGAPTARNARRHPGRRTGSTGGAGRRLGLAAERVETGLAAQPISRTNPDWRREFEETLPDLREEDIAGSGFAITGYTVHRGLGGDAALARLRERLRHRGLRLMLDFVPNHTGPDHPWVDEHPEFYVAGTESDLAQAPHNYTRVAARRATACWRTAATRTSRAGRTRCNSTTAIRRPRTPCGELLRIATQCDGVRCDMAMLVLPDVFERTWGRRAPLFWPEAIRRVREAVPGFCFMAEVYWDLEWTMQQQGFDYAYDKRLYDRLREGHARPVRRAPARRARLPGQARALPGEPRRAARGRHLRAAASTRPRPSSPTCRPGCGSSTRASSRAAGRASRRTSSARRTSRPTTRCSSSTTAARRASRPGRSRRRLALLDCVPAWEGNWTWDCFVAWMWTSAAGDRRLVVVNYAANQSQCYVRAAADAATAGALQDLMGRGAWLRTRSPRPRRSRSLPGHARLGLPRVRRHSPRRCARRRPHTVPGRYRSRPRW